MEEGGNHRIEGNFIGTDASGVDGQGNGTDGIFVAASSNNTIGGTTPGARNVISGNGSVGVQIFGLRGSGPDARPQTGDDTLELPATGNLIQGNLIGTDPTGTRAVAEQQPASSSTTPRTTRSAARRSRPATSSRGITAPSEDPSGNGVDIEGRFATQNLVLGNFIGLDASGNPPSGNELDGVFIFSASDNTIGGTLPARATSSPGTTASGSRSTAGARRTT